MNSQPAPTVRARARHHHHAILALVCAAWAGVDAATFVNRQGPGGGVISVTLQSETWTVENSPYVVEAPVNVAAGQTLEIKPGVAVQLNPSAGLWIYGDLRASGASFARNAEGPWVGIYLSPGSGASVVENCVLDGAGNFMGYIEGANRYAAILANHSAPRLTGNQIRNCDGQGILLVSSRATVTGNQFADLNAGAYAIFLANLEVFPVTADNRHTGTGVAGIAVPGGTLNGTILWNNPGPNLAYHINGSLTLAENSTWTMEGGVTCLFQGNGLAVLGTLTANGAANAHVQFAAKNPVETGDQWSGVYFGPTAGQSKLTYCDIKHAGAFTGYIRGANRYAAVWVDSCSPSFANVTIQNSSNLGVEVFESASTFTQCLFARCRAYAFLARSHSRPVLDRPAFEQNGGAGYYTAGQEANSVITPATAVFTDNAFPGVQVLGGTLETSGIWKNWHASAPYVVTATTVIAEGAELLVEPGTVVKVQGSGIVCNGTLTARGEGDPITFTSYRDDEAGGDSNGDAAASAPAPNDWRGIYLSPKSGGSILDNFKIRYAGEFQGYINGANRYAEVYVDGCSPVITNGDIAESGNHGIELINSTARIEGVRFNNMGGYPLVFDTLEAFPLLAGNSAAGRGVHGIYVPGGTITGEQRWNYPGTELAYRLEGDLGVAENAVWRIDPAVTLAGTGKRITVAGRLEALGTASQPVLFTTSQAAAAAGQWRGIYFAPTSRNSRLQYCELAYAGDFLGYFNGENRYTAIYVEGTSPLFEHLIIRDSSGNGLECWGASPVVRDAAFTRNRGYALLARNQSRPVVNQARFEQNGVGGRYTVGMDASSVIDPALASFNQNSYQGIEVTGGALDAPGRWKSWATNAPYVITRDVTVNAGVVLEVEHGSVIKVAGAGIYVNGALQADGDAGVIQFTSAKDDTSVGDTNGDGTNSVPVAGDWKGIYLSPNSGGSYFDNVSLAFAGNYLGYINGQNRYPAIYVESCSPRFNRLLIRNTQATGIDLYSSTATITGSEFADGGGYPIVFNTTDCYPLLAGNKSTRNGQPGIRVAGGTISVSGVFPRPGEDFPYVVPENIGLAAGTTLEIAPGVQFRMANVGVYVSGSLLLRGTAAAPIVFRPLAENPARGSWKGLYFGGAVASGSLLQHVEVSHAGDYLGYYAGQNRYAAIFVEQANLVPGHLRIHDSSGNGLEYVGGSVSLHDSLVYKNAGAGVAALGGATSRVVNNTIYGNSGGGVYLGNTTAGTIGNNLILGNDAYGLRSDGATATVNYNGVFGNKAPQYVGLPPGEADLTVDPLLADAANGSFQPQAGSPAVNAGLNALVDSGWTDFTDRLRVAGGRVDLGAYETASSPAVRSFDLLVREAGESSFIGQGIYEVEQQIRTATIGTNAPAVYLVQGKYDGNLPGTLRLNVSLAGPGWTTKVINLSGGGVDVTADVRTFGGLLITNTPAGGTLDYRLEVTPSASLAGFASQPVDFTALLEGVSGIQDQVRAVTTNAPRYGVDLAVRRGEDIRFTGRGVINLTALDQTRSVTISERGRAVFVVQAANLGNLPASVALKLARPSGWDVKGFDAAAGGVEITAALFGNEGYVVPAVGMARSTELRLEASYPSPAGDEFVSLLVAGAVVARPQSGDAVRAEVTLLRNQTSPASGHFTLKQDFEAGELVGVEFNPSGDQIQLGRENITFPFIWVPNSNEGTVSKVDTRTGREIGRYRTGPKGNGNPSRTTVDLRGNCWVGNRYTGTAVKIGLFENGQYIDRNHNGRIDTSTDLNGDGEITGDELLPWGQDECVLSEVVVIPGSEGTFVPGGYTGPYASDDLNPGPRGFALDADNHLWVGTYGTAKFYKVDGETGAILKTIDVSSTSHTCYGALIDAQGILWSSGQSRNHVLRLDTRTEQFTVIPMPHFVYGLGIDQQGHLYLSGWESSRLTKLDVRTGEILWTKPGAFQARGVAVTSDGDVWTANSGPGTVTRWSSEGELKVTLNVGNTPTGVAVDADGKVWVVNDGDEFIHRIDPASNQIELSKRIPGGLHYGYSDMTGIIARNTTTRIGTWTVTHNSRATGTAWGLVSWTASEPSGAKIRVQARSTEDLVTWSSWEAVTNGVALTTTLPGQFLQVEVTLQAGLNNDSPVLYDLAIEPAPGVTPPALAIQIGTPGVLEITWPVGAGADWALQAADAVAGAVWSRVATTPVIREGRYVVLAPAGDASQYFRLRR